jgi:hypothetical protein
VAAAHPTDPVNPAQLLQAFMIITEGRRPDDPDEPEHLTRLETTAILGRVADQLGTGPHVTNDLFHRCCAIANFFAVAENRLLVGVDESNPNPNIWIAAATASVQQVLTGGLACDTFDPVEFAAALRGLEN